MAGKPGVATARTAWEFTAGERLALGSGGSVVVGKILARGGQGVVYEALSDPDVVIKQIKPDVIAKDHELERKLWVMTNARPHGWQSRTGHIVLTWPLDVAYKRSKFVAFTMPRINAGSSAELHILANPSDRGRPGKDTPGWVRDFHWRYLLQAAINLAKATDALHQADVVFGDFNERNMLVSEQALVTLVDCDSMQIPDPAGAGFLCGVGRPEFTAPEVWKIDIKKTARAASSDLFPLAIHIHQLLLEGAYPFDGIWHGAGEKPSRRRLAAEGLYAYASSGRLVPPPGNIDYNLLPRSVRELFRRAFVTGAIDPALRPGAREWRETLRAMSRTLRTCQQIPQHVYPGHHKKCPWCQHQRARTQPNRTNGHGAGPSAKVLPWPGAGGQPVAPFMPPARPRAVAPPSGTQAAAPGTGRANPPAPPGRSHPGAAPHPTGAAGQGGRYALRKELRRVAKVHLLLPLAASLLATIWAVSTLQTSPGIHPYAKALVFLLRISAWTGVPALLVSLMFDALAWRHGTTRFALSNTPGWQHPALLAAAVAPPVAYFGAHWGEKFSASTGSPYGPPTLFWWLGPAALLAAHVLCLAVRTATERAQTTRVSNARPSRTTRTWTGIVWTLAIAAVAGGVFALIEMTRSGATGIRTLVPASAGAVSSSPSAGVDSAGREYVFWRGQDRGLWETWFIGGRWSQPVRIVQAGRIASAPAVAVHQDGEQDVFWKGLDGHLWESWYVGAWHKSVSLGGGIMGSAPSAGVDDTEDQFVFWRGKDRGLWETWFVDGRWARPTRIHQAGILGSRPAVAVQWNGQQDVFWKGLSGRLWELSYAGRWQYRAVKLGDDYLGSAPSVGVDHAGSEYVFWQSEDGTLWGRWRIAGRWSSATRVDQAGTLGSAPAVAVESGKGDLAWGAPGGGLDMWQSAALPQ